MIENLKNSSIVEQTRFSKQAINKAIKEGRTTSPKVIIVMRNLGIKTRLIKLKEKTTVNKSAFNTRHKNSMTSILKSHSQWK
jgi:hypothetical protein